LKMKSVGLRVLMLIVLLAVLLTALPAMAIESGLLGISIGATPQELMRTYGPAMGVIVAGAGGKPVLNTYLTGEQEILAGLELIPTAAPVAPPGWAKSVLPASLASDQQMWVYRLKGDITAGFLIKGTGEDAAVTDIIAFSLEPNPTVETEGGIRLGDSFAKVLLNYGYPPVLQPYAGRTEAAAPAAPTRALSGGGSPQFGRMGGAMRPGRGGRPAGIGARRGVAAARGTGPVPTLGATATVPTGKTQVAVLNHQPITFSKNCMILYNGLAFTLYDFKVVRVQVTQ
jgi:hypothetical protein